MKLNYHTSCLLNNTNNIEDSIQVINNLSHKQAIKELYKGRVAPVQVFLPRLVASLEKLLASCNNILDLEERAKFLQNLETTVVFIFFNINMILWFII